MIIICIASVQSGVLVSYIVWACSWNFTIFVVARIIGGLCKGNVTISTAIVTDATSVKNRGKGMVWPWNYNNNIAILIYFIHIIIYNYYGHCWEMVEKVGSQMYLHVGCPKYVGSFFRQIGTKIRNVLLIWKLNRACIQRYQQTMSSPLFSSGIQYWQQATRTRV